MPTTTQDSNERSEAGNAGLCHLPLCPFSFCGASEASAEDRGSVLLPHQGKPVLRPLI